MLTAVTIEASLTIDTILTVGLPCTTGRFACSRIRYDQVFHSLRYRTIWLTLKHAFWTLQTGSLAFTSNHNLQAGVKKPGHDFIPLYVLEPCRNMINTTTLSRPDV